jgi:hypothetical protein
MSADLVMLTITRIEALHLADLVGQFDELLDETDSATADAAVARLVPDAYPDDEEAAQEFRHATEQDLLARRSSDAQRMLADLAGAGALTPEADAQVDDVIDVALDADAARAWLRTLAAIRLVIASRLGIETEEDHDEDDPRFGVYDWLGYRLEGLVQAIDGD